MPLKSKKEIKETKEIPELIYSSTNRSTRDWISILKKKKLIRKIGPRLFTSVDKKKEKQVVKSSWIEILSNLFPNAFITHRTALEYSPSPGGIIYITGNVRREVNYPGLIIKFLKGPSPIESDVDFINNLKASSFERALLENLSTVKTKKESKTVGQGAVEAKLEQYLHNKGEQELNKLRNRAREIAIRLNLKREFKKLNSIIGVLLGSQDYNGLKSDKAIAKVKGIPYDANCLETLEALFAALKTYPFSPIVENITNSDHFKNKAFFESYFSNYIEGTIFEIEEAEEIVFDRKISTSKPQDAHDILGTYLIVSDPNEMKVVPHDSKELVSIIRKRHKLMLSKRSEINPGEFKNKPNRAGSTHFVHPEYVLGSLIRGFEFYKALDKGIARSIFIMFLINEIHPFSDGNGRIARIMMNVELNSQNLSTIIIPNSYRDDYLGALRAMTRRHRAQPLIEMFIKAHQFSHINFSNYPKVLKYLQNHNWFAEPDEAKLIY